MTVASLGLGLSIALAGTVDLMANPGTLTNPHALAQNVDYISTEAGYALDLGFPVLVPGWVPSPFGGSPSIDAGGGYYGLYWMNAGGDPTFLHITGQVGGGLPAGSPYDLNNELFINANVMGYDAIHDVTPAYDAVWWIMGGVLYKVESRNSSTDSLSLANSLITFVPPTYTAPEPTSPPPAPTDEPVYEEPATEEPATEEPVYEEPVTEAPETSDPVATEPVVQQPGDVPSEVVTDGSGAAEETPAAVEVSGESTGDTTSETPVPSGLTTDGTGQSGVDSDGTGGALIAVIGGDGTGGTADVYVPRRAPVGVQVP